MEKPIVDNNYLLEKFPGKGGWTYATIPEIAPDRKSHFNWVKVKGWIDNYELKCYNLAPMGDGRMFLPVKAEIRKKIGKQAGDTVHVTLYADDSALEIPENLLLCLEEEPVALKNFNSWTESERKWYIEWIASAKREETQIDRIAKTINRALLGLRFHDKEI
jgi:hypothetical protein